MPPRPVATRRSALLGAAAAGGVLAGAGEGRALAATAYAPAHWRRDTLLGAQARHLVTRFSYGLTQGLARQVIARGGAQAWLDWQLAPHRIKDTAADTVDAWFPHLALGPAQVWANQTNGVEGGWELMADYARRLILRRIRTQRPVLELMTDLFENHFNVPADGDAQFTWRARYGEVIRTHALGRFDQMLRAAVTHPAMLIYLDNATSTKAHPNENLGRELLELHTVGRGSYTEDDVKSSARILTGWHVEEWTTWAASYRPADHWTGPVQVMGFSAANADPDGRALTYRYLDYLARHPATARRVARKLAVRFVRDDPSDALVNRLARVYLAHDTALVPVVRALVGSTEFAESAGLKVRDPVDDVVASYRALGIRLAAPTADESGANAVLWQAGNLGTTPMGWPRPDGQPLDGDSWSSPTRVMASLDLHYTLCGGWWPTVDATYRTRASWLPADPVRFDLLVDHLAQVLLHRRATATLLEAACRAVDCTPGEVITPAHAVAQWNMPRLLTVFLDSPTFFSR